MLILAINEGEFIQVDGPARIYLVRNGITPRLGFDCPETTEVLREKFVPPDEPEESK